MNHGTNVKVRTCSSVVVPAVSACGMSMVCQSHALHRTKNCLSRPNRRPFSGWERCCDSLHRGGIPPVRERLPARTRSGAAKG